GAGFEYVGADRLAALNFAVVLDLDACLALGILAHCYAADLEIAQYHVGAGDTLDGLEDGVDGAVADGPIDAVFKAIERITGTDVVLRDFQIRSVTVGEDAQGEARVEVEHNGKIQRGQAVSTDVLEASA